MRNKNPELYDALVSNGVDIKLIERVFDGNWYQLPNLSPVPPKGSEAEKEGLKCGQHVQFCNDYGVIFSGVIVVGFADNDCNKYGTEKIAYTVMLGGGDAWWMPKATEQLIKVPETLELTRFEAQYLIDMIVDNESWNEKVIDRAITQCRSDDAFRLLRKLKANMLTHVSDRTDLQHYLNGFLK